MAGIKMLPGETKSEYWKRVEAIIDGMDYVHSMNGQVVARYPKQYRVVPSVVDELTGILKVEPDFDPEEAKAEYFREKYAAAY